MAIWGPFDKLRRRNKVLFTVLMAASVIIFWKGIWGLSSVIIDDWVFGNHLFWANLFSMLIGLVILILSGLAIEKLA
ncbi:MAG: hypothetical protein WC308_02295 [archaeon]|jgi:hypothetical protein